LVKCAAGLAVGSGLATAGSAFAQETDKPAGAAQAKSADESLAWARRSPQSFMLSAPQIFALDIDNYSRDLYITSARDEHGNPERVRVPSQSVRIFRADANLDEFTRQGGMHWHFRDKPGKVKLPKATGSEQVKLSAAQPVRGEKVMVVRDRETVRCYTMTPDERC